MSVAFGQAWSSLYIHCLSYIHQHKRIEHTVENQLALDHNDFQCSTKTRVSSIAIKDENLLSLSSTLLCAQVRGAGRGKRAPSLALRRSSLSRMPRRLWCGCRSVFLLSSYVAGRPRPPPQPAAPAFFHGGAVLPPCGRRAHCWTEAPPVCLISTHQSSEGSLHRGTLQRWGRPETFLLTLFPEMRVLCLLLFVFLSNGTWD